MLGTAVVVVALVGSSGMAAVASDGSTEQSVEVEVVPRDAVVEAAEDPVAVPEDLLMIEVEPILALGPVVAGASVERPFWIRVLNTTSAGWEVTVEAGDLVRTARSCGPQDPGTGTGSTAADVIPASSLRLRGGAIDGLVLGQGGTLAEQPLLLMSGAAAADRAQLEFGGAQPSLEVSIPAGTSAGCYGTTLTYTIMSTGEDAP